MKPTLAELERFEEQPEDVNLEIVTSTKEDASGTHSFSMGDNVEVSVGDLENLQAKIIAIDGNIITVLPKHQDLKVGKQTYNIYIRKLDRERERE